MKIVVDRWSADFVGRSRRQHGTQIDNTCELRSLRILRTLR